MITVLFNVSALVHDPLSINEITSSGFTLGAITFKSKMPDVGI